jgi:N-methylhydantoinase B
VPPNAGSFRRVKVHLREGCIAGIPVHPISCSVSTTNIADRIGNTTARAIAEIAEGFGMSSTGSILPPSTGVISGVDPRTSKRFVNQLFVGWGGGAAGAQCDAWLSVGHIGNSGLSYQDSIELDELRFPLRVRRRHVIKDSGGAGRNRGGDGIYVEFAPLGCEVTVSYTSDGNITASEGVRGGKSGSVARQYVRDPSGALRPAEACAQVTLKPGEAMVSLSCGGGGYGSPLERGPERVAENVKEGWVTPDRARADYGVVVNEAGRLDTEATAALRRELRGLADEPLCETKGD